MSDALQGLFYAVAAYRMAVQSGIELRSEQRALERRLREIPAEQRHAQQRENEARLFLLQLAGGSEHGQKAVEQIERDIAQSRAYAAVRG